MRKRIACVDGLKGFPDTIEAVFSKAVAQLCCMHMVRHRLNTYPGSAEGGCRRSAPGRVRGQMGWQVPTHWLSWRSNWSWLTPFFDYPPEIRKVIYTTNAIESVNMSLRKLTKNRDSFPSDEALTKLFYLACATSVRSGPCPSGTGRPL